MLDTLPTELISHILSYALETTSILLISKLFLSILQPLLHANLQFSSSNQLHQFAHNSGRGDLACPPRRFSLVLPGGVKHIDVWIDLRDAFLRCMPRDSEQLRIPLDLEVLRLQMNTHTHDPNHKQIHSALSLTSPRTFIWTGPDPTHHFSTAIVPLVLPSLFSAISTWPHLKHLTLTNISFASHSPFTLQFTLPTSLQMLELGQAVFLPPPLIVSLLLCSSSSFSNTFNLKSNFNSNLEQVKLVDTYSESIWGLRIRRGDIEKAAIEEVDSLALDGVNVDKERLLERIRRVVICERVTERIMGGDRVEGTSILI